MSEYLVLKYIAKNQRSCGSSYGMRRTALLKEVRPQPRCRGIVVVPQSSDLVPWMLLKEHYNRSTVRSEYNESSQEARASWPLSPVE